MDEWDELDYIDMDEDLNELDTEDYLIEDYSMDEEESERLREAGMLDFHDESDEIDVVGLMRDVLEQNVSKQKLPAESKVEWENPDSVGDGACCLNDDAVVNVYNKADKTYREYTGSEFKNHMMKRYGVDSVRYSHREPDFTPFEFGFKKDDINDYLQRVYGNDTDRLISEECDGHIEVENMNTERRGEEGTFRQAENYFAEKLGISLGDLRGYMKEKDIVWHECGDRKTIRAIPNEINQVFGHTGGIGIQKDLEVLRESINEKTGGMPIKLCKENLGGKVEVLNGSLQGLRVHNLEIKRNKFKK